MVCTGHVCRQCDGRPALALDLAEEFRALPADSCVVRHPVFGYRVTYRRAVELQARILAAYLVGELPRTSLWSPADGPPPLPSRLRHPRRPPATPHRPGASRDTARESSIRSFICDLSDREKILMRGDIEAIMKLSEDSVMIIDLGPAGDSSAVPVRGPP